MSPAESKFIEVEWGLKRTQCLLRVLRDITERSLNTVDEQLWNGVFAVASEAEAAADTAASVWGEAHKLTAKAPR